MRRPRLAVLAFVTMFLTGVSSVAAQGAASAAAPATAGTAVLRGFVRDSVSGLPVPYAVIAIPSRAVERFTGPDGAFSIGRLAAVRVTTHFREIAPGLGVVQSICSVTDPQPRSAARMVEYQQLARYDFLAAPPPGLALSAQFRVEPWEGVLDESDGSVRCR